MMGEKLESVSITVFRGREFYGRCSKLTISTLSESNVWGKKSWEKKRREANGVNVFKILTFGPIREQQNLTFDQLGTVRNFKKGGKLKTCEFWET